MIEDHDDAYDFELPCAMGYMREGDLDGVPVWTLFDEAGTAILVTDNRSSVFFYANWIDMEIVTRH